MTAFTEDSKRAPLSRNKVCLSDHKECHQHVVFGSDPLSSLVLGVLLFFSGVKAKDGRLLSNDEEKLARWAEHQ